MPQLAGNASNFNFIDTTINRSMDFISTAVNQLLQLIFCLLAIITIARIVSFFIAPKPPTEVVAANAQKSDGKVQKIESKKVKIDEISGWESESLTDQPQPQLDVPQKVTKHQTRLPKRKCMSVGPVMLTPNSQIIRKVNADEGEERFSYDILPLNNNLSSKHENSCNISKDLTPQSSIDITDACVLTIFFEFYYFIMFLAIFLW